MQYESKETEDRTMEYSKPEVTVMGPALEAVRSHGAKVRAAIADSPYDLVATPNAYEADE